MAMEQDTLELEFGHPSNFINLGADGKQPIRGSRTLVAWGVATADDDLGGRAIHNFEVVR